MMPQLTNNGDFLIAAFYRFVPISRPRELRELALKRAEERAIMGTLLIAKEGVNATLAAPAEQLHAFLDWLQRQPGLGDLSVRWSSDETAPFERLKVKVRDEIVTMGVDGLDPNRTTGEHVDAKTWNRLIAEPSARVIDTRNRYEHELGTFENAIDPATESFKDFPDYVATLEGDKKSPVVMFCTGGIRCEKASAYMLERGFEKVYQLDGGILNYLSQVDPQENRFRGECFVFDDRVTVDDQLTATHHEICGHCRMPIMAEDRGHSDYDPGVSCPRCADRLTPERRAGLIERRRQRALAAQRK